MAAIEVNLETLRNVSSAITTYCDAQDIEMNSADHIVKGMLISDWTGQDANAYGGKWADVYSSDSTAVRFRDNLKNFRDAVSASAKEYQAAQEDSYNAANRLPRVLIW